MLNQPNSRIFRALEVLSNSAINVQPLARLEMPWDGVFPTLLHACGWSSRSGQSDNQYPEHYEKSTDG
ncbi:MAG TPA: hypothetical protein VJA21_07135 [Verrucomicrobiae bacterium]